MTIGPLSVEEYDNQGFEVRKCEGGLETLFEFILEVQDTPIHVLLHNEVTAKTPRSLPECTQNGSIDRVRTDNRLFLALSDALSGPSESRRRMN